MGLAELVLLAVGLSMDAFAVSICKGLGMKKINLKVAVVLGLFFGGFQAGMPVIGWALGSQFMGIIGPIDHWIAFILLAFIGGKMLWEAFTEDEDEGVVGGGIGVPPMLQTAKHYGSNATAILGFRDKDKIVLTEDFERSGIRVMLATDDGSAGHHGLVTDLLKVRLEEEKPDIVYACGPKVMLKFVARMCAEYNVRCQVSLEERMACGVGACLGCATPIRRDDGSVTYLHVCKDGPVFEAERVVFDD